MYQRALPQTKRDLGEWERALWFQLYAAVVQVPPPPGNAIHKQAIVEAQGRASMGTGRQQT